MRLDLESVFAAVGGRDRCMQVDDRTWMAESCPLCSGRYSLKVAKGTAAPPRSYEQYQHLRAIESGELEDRRFFGRWIEAPVEADYKAPATWEAANPSYGVTVHSEFFEDQLSKKSENGPEVFHESVD